jgi:hypothetical protein
LLEDRDFCPARQKARELEAARGVVPLSAQPRAAIS